MMGTMNCVYETPCGWCSKWDKKCDRKIKSCKTKPTEQVNEENLAAFNKICVSESNHEWECVGMSTAGTTYRCKKCYTHKTIPIEYEHLSITI